MSYRKVLNNDYSTGKAKIRCDRFLRHCKSTTVPEGGIALCVTLVLWRLGSRLLAKALGHIRMVVKRLVFIINQLLDK